MAYVVIVSMTLEGGKLYQDVQIVQRTRKSDKEWTFGRFRVKMYKCTKCGNQFREYFKESTLQFVLSAHNGGLGKIRATKETTDRHKSHQ